MTVWINLVGRAQGEDASGVFPLRSSQVVVVNTVISITN